MKLKNKEKIKTVLSPKIKKESEISKLKKSNIKEPISMENILKYFLLICGTISFFWGMYYTLTHINEPKLINVVLALPFILFLAPYLSIGLYQVKRVESKLESIPRFLRDVVDNVESGMDMVTSIKATTENEYGSLNEDILKLSNHLAWGIDFDKALIEFANNVGSLELKRDFLLVVEARRIGGHPEKILRELSSKISTDILRKKQRKSDLSSNTFTGYISFMIFLLIIILIYNNLFLGLGNAAAQPGVDPVSDLAANPDTPSVVASNQTLIYLTLLILLSYELAILSGLLFGLMQENNVISGAPHVAALIFLTFIAFYFFIQY